MTDRATPALPLDYEDVVYVNLIPAFRAVAVLEIIIGFLNCLSQAVSLFPYLSNQVSYPADFPSKPAELLLNLLPFVANVFGIIAAILMLSSSKAGLFLVWAWSYLVITFCASVFNIIFELWHVSAYSAAGPYAGHVGTYLTTRLAWLLSRLIGASGVPIVVIVLCRFSFATMGLNRENAPHVKGLNIADRGKGRI